MITRVVYAEERKLSQRYNLTHQVPFYAVLNVGLSVDDQEPDVSSRVAPKWHGHFGVNAFSGVTQGRTTPACDATAYITHFFMLF